MMKLPRCDDLDDDFSLSPEERRELLIELATKGAGALDKYVRRLAEKKDSSVAKRIEKIRKKLESQSHGMKMEVLERFRKKRNKMRDSFKRIKERSREKDFQRQMGDVKIGDMISLDDLEIEDDSLIDIILDMDRYGGKGGRFDSIDAYGERMPAKDSMNW